MSDRGMKKWAPFRSLVEQTTSLTRLKQERQKIEKPLISSDKAEEINDILINHSHEELEFSLFLNGYIKTIVGYIDYIDTVNHFIKLKNGDRIFLKDIVGIKVNVFSSNNFG